MDKILKFILITCIGFVYTMIVYTGGYKNGQVNALTGKIEYELVKLKDSTSYWNYKKQIK